MAAAAAVQVARRQEQAVLAVAVLVATSAQGLTALMVWAAAVEAVGETILEAATAATAS